MTVTLKNTKRRMFSTWVDVVARAKEIVGEDIDMIQGATQTIVVNQGIVENFIQQSDAIISARLRNVYSDDTDLRTTAWASVPFVQSGNSDTDAKLLGIIITDNSTVDPYTASWYVKFTAATTYNVISSLEGTQMTAAVTGVDCTSSNSNITIGTNAWTGTFAANEKVFFSVVDAHPLIWTISNMLATSMTLQRVFGQEYPNMSDYGDSLASRANELLDKLADPQDSGMSITGYSKASLASTWIDYYVDDLGIDRSSYLEDDAAQADRHWPWW